jgi:hypothetical protein
MSEILLFAEDNALEKVVRVLIDRIARELGADVHIRVRTATRGYPHVCSELSRFASDIRRGREMRPDIVVAAVDANCHGIEARRREIDNRLSGISIPVVCAIADPHVERWLLLDGAAFKGVLGVGCKAPDRKCERERYKQLLAAAIREAGVEPLLGGVEFAEDIVARIDLNRAASADDGFNRFVTALRAALQSGINKTGS